LGSTFEVELGAVGQRDGPHHLAALLGLGDGVVEAPPALTASASAEIVGM
jgi:hypothetical protein